MVPSSLIIQQNTPPFEVMIPEVPYATGYNWTIPSSTQILSGDGTNSITIDWGESTNSDSICVSAFNECGSSPATCMEIIVDLTNRAEDLK